MKIPAKTSHLVRAVIALGLVLMLTGCGVSDWIEFFHLNSLVAFFTAGPIAEYQRNLMLIVFVIMLFVLVPVVGFTFWFAYNYRASNRKATYHPNWHHSGFLEGFLWGGPVVIILILGTITVISTYDLDPYEPIQSDERPVQVEAIAMDWKWLFVYPELNMAAVNQMAMPVNVPVEINLTSASVMAGFMIPRLGSQIMVMSGMGTQINLMAHEKGIFFGKNYQYSGDGFADMTFQAKSMSEAGFKQWVSQAHGSDRELDMDAYEKLVKPSHDVPVSYFSAVPRNLFEDVIGAYKSGDGKMSEYDDDDGDGKVSQAGDSAMDSSSAQQPTQNSSQAGHAATEPH